ncbi:MAG TPA: hypothetical protein VIU61_21255 [Kofleriaceae bacterium]
MKLVRICALALLVACGPAGTGDDDDGMSMPGDADGDTISDADEGTGDTDGDGTPDLQDSDSDGDGIPDYREAGDGDPSSKPIDSDLDGTPDFQDLDSDNNGRSDTLDGLDDIDGDTVSNFQDQDDDGDQIPDVDELGPNPQQPTDSDGDGTADFRDTDSDNDTITDFLETNQDYDMDGAGNYLDLDSDADCISDQIEAGGNPPLDTDMDHHFDFIDRDSDNDGVPDVTEDANCNGVQDPGESSSKDEDSDNDGVSDMIEVAAGTDPTDPNDNPQANGDFVFVEPYMKPQSPLDDDLDFSTKLQAVDLYVLLDRSGSMSAEITTVKNNLASVVANLKCPPNVTTNCIPDLWAGAGTIGYSGSGIDAYRNWVDIQPNPSFVSVPTTEPGGCCAEPLTFGAFSAVTGQGGAAYGFSGVQPRNTCVGSPAANAGYGTFGYPCFRQGALPVIMLATDEVPLSAGDTNKTPNWDTIVKPQYTAAKARLVGILGSAYGANTDVDLRKMATDTGAIDALNGNAPLVFDGAGTNSAAAIQQGILRLANGLPLDINAVGVDDPTDAVDAMASFVDHLETLQLGTANCANGLNDIDSNADGYDDKYVQVRTGTPVCWKVVSKPNVSVPATDAPQLFRAKVKVYGDGITQLDERDVFFLVPPAPFDDPIF